MLRPGDLAFQASLVGCSEPVGLRPLTGLRRRQLTDGAWIDTLPGWLSGADDVFGRLLDRVPWHEEHRVMYDRNVAVPRLLRFYDVDETLPDPMLAAALRALGEHYEDELGERFRTTGLCLYRDGRDSVAWHGDRIGRGSFADTMVAILSLGQPRALSLRQRRSASHGPGRPGTLRYELGHGDLLVMGGSCQRTWEHAVVKTARPVGPRISVQFRPVGVR